MQILTTAAAFRITVGRPVDRVARHRRSRLPGRGSARPGSSGERNFGRRRCGVPPQTGRRQARPRVPGDPWRRPSGLPSPDSIREKTSPGPTVAGQRPRSSTGRPTAAKIPPPGAPSGAGGVVACARAPAVRTTPASARPRGKRLQRVVASALDTAGLDALLSRKQSGGVLASGLAIGMVASWLEKQRGAKVPIRSVATAPHARSVACPR